MNKKKTDEEYNDRLDKQKKEIKKRINPILYEMENHISGNDSLLFFAHRIKKELNK